MQPPLFFYFSKTSLMALIKIIYIAAGPFPAVFYFPHLLYLLLYSLLVKLKGLCFVKAGFQL